MIIDKLLTPNKYSRPQTKIEVKGIVVHYVGNPRSTAMNNRDYFEGNKDRKVFASSHYIIGLDGEIIRCIPDDEIAYCSNERNKDTLSIECCHPDKSGKFNTKTINSLRRLLKDLVKKHNLKYDDVIRHYDVTQKKCPLYFADNQDEWDKFKASVFSLTFEEALDILVEEGVIETKTYWRNAVRCVKYLDKLIINMGGKLNDNVCKSKRD